MRASQLCSSSQLGCPYRLQTPPVVEAPEVAKKHQIPASLLVEDDEQFFDMLLPPDVQLQQRLRKWAAFLMYAAGFIAVLVLLGWQIDVSFLKRVFPGMVAMNPATAVCFLLVATSFLLWRSQSPASQRTRYISLALAIAVVLIGLQKIGGLLFDFDWRLDKLLFAPRVKAEVAEGFSNRISPTTAINFVCSGVALVLLHFQNRIRRASVDVISLLIILAALLSLLGYLYQVEHFVGFLHHIKMALNTALCFFLVGISLLIANPDRGIMRELTSESSGSVAARILIPAAVIVPALLGLLRLWGFWEGVYNNEFGVALYALITIVIFTILVWYNTFSLNRRDLHKKQTDEALHASEVRSRGIFDNAPDSIIVIDDLGKVVDWNPEATKLFGWSSEEAIGQELSEMIIPVEFREAHRRGMHRFLTTGESSILGISIDLWANKKDGSGLDISLRISPLLLNEKRFFIGFIRDITERKKLENRLRTFNEELGMQVKEKTAELVDIFERVTDGFIALDEQFRYTYMNKKAGELVRMEPSSLIGRYVWDVFPDAVGSATYEAMERSMRDQVNITNTDYYEPLQLWQENHVYPSPKGLSIFIRDISEKKKAEVEIMEASDLADKLIDSLPGVFYFYDATGKFIRWNKQFEESTEYTAAEIAEMHPVDFFPPDEREYISQRIGGVFDRGINDAEANFLTKSGKRIPYYFKAVLIQYKGGPCLLGSGIDIAERKKAEEQLRSSEQKYKLLFESNPLPMWMLGLPDYRVREVNQAALLQYGYTKEEFLELDIFTLRPSEDIERLKANTNRTFRGIFHAGVWRHRKRNGDIIYVDIVTYDLYYDEKPVRLVLANDVTEQYLAEEKLKDSYEAIRKLTEHLQNIREEERLHIAREIHDELGQLLTVLKMDVSWLNKKIQPASEPVRAKLEELLGLIDTTVKTVRRIASELRPSLLDDLGLLAAMEWHLEEFERRSGIEKLMELPGTELHLPDSIKIGLFRIFQESLTNVARHSGAEKVSVRLVQEDKKLILTISDNGKGMAGNTSEKKTLGVLGMKERTLVMGGDFKLISAPGQGTTINVSVPIP